MTLTPLARYDHAVATGRITSDVAQRALAERLSQLARELGEKPSRRASRARFWSSWVRREPPPRGIYIWGGVGRGKTFLMDLLVESLPPGWVERVHFHHFMRGVHRRLTELKGKPNPLALVGAEIAARTRLLCFDEWFVGDITDAMILANLLESLLAEGVVLVVTSNVAPTDLYRDGLQRERFLPAIALLERELDIWQLVSLQDYRLRELTRAPLYHTPLGAHAEAAMAEHYRRLVGREPEPAPPLLVEGRPIAMRAGVAETAWFEFDALCRGPRSQRDYLWLAGRFHTLLLSNLVISAEELDAARRFIYLVDVCYDQRVKLLISAAVPLPDLSPGGRLAFEFERTVSRLLEMQSEAYLAEPHRASTA